MNNNKWFNSNVVMIVIAIIGILAVSAVLKLTWYEERSFQADSEIIYEIESTENLSDIGLSLIILKNQIIIMDNQRLALNNQSPSATDIMNLDKRISATKKVVNRYER